MHNLTYTLCHLQILPSRSIPSPLLRARRMALRQAVSLFSRHVWAASPSNSHLVSRPMSTCGREWSSSSLGLTGVEFSFPSNYGFGAHVVRSFSSELAAPAATAQMNNSSIVAHGWYWSSEGNLSFRSTAPQATSCQASHPLVSPRRPADGLHRFCPKRHEIDMAGGIPRELAISKVAPLTMPCASRGFASSSRSVLQQQACASRPTAKFFSASCSLFVDHDVSCFTHFDPQPHSCSALTVLSLVPPSSPLPPDLFDRAPSRRSGSKCTSRALASLVTRTVLHPHPHPTLSCTAAESSAA